MKESLPIFDFAAFCQTIQSDTQNISKTNIFELSGFPHWELVASNIWAYFLDPSKPHGLGTIFYDALLGLLANKENVVIPSEPEARTTDLDVRREFITKTGHRVDIAILSDSVSLAIENKVDAGLYNDLNDYHEAVSTAVSGGQTYLIVLAPRSTKEELPADSKGWAFSVSYDELFEAVNQHLSFDVLEEADARSLEIYRQFIESQSQKRKEQSRMKANDTITMFLDKIEGKDELINNYYRDLGDYIAACKSKLHSIWRLVKKEKACKGWEWEGVDSRHNAYPNIWYALVTENPHFTFEFFVYPWVGEAQRFAAIQYKAYHTTNQAKKNHILPHWNKYLCEITDDSETIVQCVIQKIDEIASDLE